MDKGQVFYVYVLTNPKGEVEYVGESTRPKTRLYEHTRRTPKVRGSHGKFYGRTDLTLEIVSEHATRKESFDAQCVLQAKYGLPTDDILISQNSPANGAKSRVLTYQQAEEIRHKYNTTKIKQAQLAREYNVSSPTIYRILINKYYNNDI
jgi:predicted GIY-YIG superfamily endonuclease